MDNLIDALLNNEILTPEQRVLLPECQRQHNVGYDFGTQEINHKTLHDYIIYMKCLDISIKSNYSSKRIGLVVA